MNSTTVNDIFAVVHAAAAIAALAFALRVLLIELIPGFAQLRRLFGRTSGGLTQIALGQVSAIIERVKLVIRGFAVLWILFVIAVAEIFPAVIALSVGGWVGLTDYYRALPPTAVVFLLAALLPAAIIYWLPDWLEQKARRYIERYGRKVTEAIKYQQARQSERNDSVPRIEK